MKVRLYFDDLIEEGRQLIFTDDRYNYLANVLKVKQGQSVLLFNANDGEFVANVIACQKKKITLQVGEKTAEPEALPDVWLLFAVLKKDAIDLLVQKGTELGCGTFYPIFSDRTVVDKVRLDRLAVIAAEAAEQSRRVNVPLFAMPKKLQEVLDKWDNNRKLFFFDETGKGKTAIEALKEYKYANPSQPVAFLIGPEGGFSPNEIKLLYSLPFAVGVSLDNHILKAETAAAVALALWKYV